MKITPPMTAKGMYFFIKACLLRALAFFWYFFDSYDSVLDILVTSREDQTQVSPEILDISRGRDLREGERERERDLLWWNLLSSFSPCPRTSCMFLVIML